MDASGGPVASYYTTPSSARGMRRTAASHERRSMSEGRIARTADGEVDPSETYLCQRLAGTGISPGAFLWHLWKLEKDPLKRAEYARRRARRVMLERGPPAEDQMFAYEPGPDGVWRLTSSVAGFAVLRRMFDGE